MRIARPWAMPVDINKDGSHSQGIFISPMLCYFKTVILLLSCLTFWTPHVSHSSYAFISNFTTPSSIFKTTVDCFSKGFLNNFPKVNVYSFSSHFAVVFIEYWYYRIIKYVKAIVLYYGMKGYVYRWTKNKMRKSEMHADNCGTFHSQVAIWIYFWYV